MLDVCNQHLFFQNILILKQLAILSELERPSMHYSLFGQTTQC